VGSTTGFSVNSLNIDNPKFVTWDDTSLVKVESELSLGFSLVHETLVDGLRVGNNSISLIFNIHFFLLSQTLVMSNI